MVWTKLGRPVNRGIRLPMDAVARPTETAAAAVANPFSAFTGYLEEWDFSDTTKITHASNAVSQVDGQAGLYSLVQSTAGKKPTTNTDTINSLNVLKFDGGDCLTVASFPLGAFTIYTVYKLSGTPGMLYEQSADTFNNSGFCCYGTTGGGIARRTALGTDNWDTTLDWSVDDAVHLIAHVWDGTDASHDLFQDGTSIRGASISYSDGGTGTVTATLNLGSRNNAASLGVTGDLAHVIVYGAAHSSGDRSSIRTLIQSKWGTP